MPSYLEISVRCLPKDEDLVAGFITTTLSQGLVTEVDDDDYVVKFYLPAEDSSRDKVEDLGRHLVKIGLVQPESLDRMISVRPIAEVDWIETYKKSFKPVVVDDYVIKSTWDTTEYPGKTEIVIEPKMAFGTGHHETTQLCMRQLAADLKPGDRLLDLGCGSGILCVQAAKLGASECYGLDIDIVAIENAQENIAINKVADTVTVEFGSMEKVRKFGHYDVVVSNLIKDEIFNLFESFIRALRPGGTLILSGILKEQEKEFQSFLKLKNPQGFLVTRMNEWICCRVTKAK